MRLGRHTEASVFPHADMGNIHTVTTIYWKMVPNLLFH